MADRSSCASSWRTRFGLAGERFAEAQLRGAGLDVLARRFRTRNGEIDLVARDGETLVFVEVKARSTRRWGDGAISVDWRKRTRIRAAAFDYLRRHPHRWRSLRFDVVEIGRQSGTLRARWLRDAFRDA